MKEKFWDKVYKCKHEATKDYLVTFDCDTPYCNGMEWHCEKCGVYITECDCGGCIGMSGWSSKRWKNYNKKKEIKKYPSVGSLCASESNKYFK